jgi:hypothetical protein
MDSTEPFPILSLFFAYEIALLALSISYALIRTSPLFSVFGQSWLSLALWPP